MQAQDDRLQSKNREPEALGSQWTLERPWGQEAFRAPWLEESVVTKWPHPDVLGGAGATWEQQVSDWDTEL